MVMVSTVTRENNVLSVTQRGCKGKNGLKRNHGREDGDQCDHEAGRLKRTGGVGVVGERSGVGSGTGGSIGGGSSTSGGTGATSGVSSAVAQEVGNILRELELGDTSGKSSAGVECLDTGVLGKEVTVVDDAGESTFALLNGDGTEIEVVTPGVGRSALGLGVDGSPSSSEIGGLSSHQGHEGRDGDVGAGGLGHVDDTEHSLGAVGRDSAVEVDGLVIGDSLGELSGALLDTRGEEGISGLVAEVESRSLGDGVVLGAVPDELDGLADGDVDHGGNVTENAILRSNEDSDELASGRLAGLSGRSRRGSPGGWGSAIRSHALVDTVVVGVLGRRIRAGAVLGGLGDRARLDLLHGLGHRG